MFKKASIILLLVFLLGQLFSQVSEQKHIAFCKNLNKVFEIARTGNLDAYDGIMVKKSAFLAVPDYSIQLERFAINYVDKDERFVAKTNINMDSASALQALEDYKLFVNYCLDSTNWLGWDEMPGDDTYTPFFKELKQTGIHNGEINLRLAIVIVAPKVYSLNMYITRRK